MSSREVVEAFFAFRAAQDVDMACALLHDSIVYKIHAATNNLPFGGEQRGVDACRNVLFSILKDFDYLAYEPTILSARGLMVRTQVRFKYRHRRTGGILEGTRRLVFKVKGGRIVRIDGYHDAKLVAAFMKLTEYRLANNMVAETPVLPKRETQGSA
jgi:ketosteroid isomerase-like protein